MPTKPFRVGLTHDFLSSAGEPVFGDIGLGLLAQEPGLVYDFIDADDSVISADIAARYDALIVLAPRVTAETLGRSERRIAGAALDVFEQEPTPATNPLLTLDNVIATPHAICWTDECFYGNGSSACRSILSVARGEVPTNLVNRVAVENYGLQARLKELAGKSER